MLQQTGGIVLRHLAQQGVSVGIEEQVGVALP